MWHSYKHPSQTGRYRDSPSKTGTAPLFFSSRRRHTRGPRDWSSDVCSSDLLEGRILSLEQMLKKAVVIEQNGHHDLVEIGSKVVVEAEGERNEYVIVGSAEASPGEGRISNESPVGKALIGHRAGETVKLTVPAGAVQMKILGVS